ncbi:MAG: Ig-like domain-containing protein, partial [Paraprevotella sp.]|nr:Ig-like domain-containing protein [Paraprevotella sp.]
MMHTTKVFVATLVIALVMAACASIGSPDGGPYDQTPPAVVRCTPENKAVGITRKKLAILFDEYVKLENANENIVVSPPQQEAPNIRAEGKKVKIELYDTLQSNTTYTIDFGNAIVDNNEGNPLGLYTYSFSTGNHIDTMEISGNVLNAENLEPIKGILVGLYSDHADSAFTSKPLERVSRTNGSGRFTIKGIAPGKYRIFALKDADGNYTFNQKNEALAFDSTIIKTSCAPDVRFDTVWVDSIYYDTIKQVPYTHFYPDNIVLRAFIEEGQDRHLIKMERPVPNKFTVYFTAPSDSLPQIQGLNFNADNAFIIESS